MSEMLENIMKSQAVAKLPTDSIFIKNQFSVDTKTSRVPRTDSNSTVAVISAF